MTLRVYTDNTKGGTISKENYGFLNSPKKWTKLIILSQEDDQDLPV